MPNVTAMDGVGLVIRNGGQIPTVQLRDFVRGSLVIYAATDSFSALTNLLESDIDLRSGAKLALTNFTRLVLSNSSVNFVVHDAGTVLDLSNVTHLVADPRFILSAWAYSGGRIDLRRLLKPDATLDAYAEGVNRWTGMANPARGSLKGLCLLVLVVLTGWGLWRFVRWIGFRRGGPGSGSGPSVREPRPPGGRPPTLSAAARAEDD